MTVKPLADYLRLLDRCYTAIADGSWREANWPALAREADGLYGKLKKHEQEAIQRAQWKRYGDMIGAKFV